MSRPRHDWTRDEIETVATCLTDDLRSAGPRFSTVFTPPTPSAQAITSVPPSDAPPAPGGPGSGGFVEGGGALFIEDFERLDLLPDHVKRLMGSMHAALGEPADTAIALHMDGVAVMWIEFWSGLDHVEQVADLLDQVQDVVMESTAERWPRCPAHDHELLPRQGGTWAEWQCPDTGDAIARFGQLTEQMS